MKNENKIYLNEISILLSNLLSNTFMTKEDSENILSLVKQINNIYRIYNEKD